MRRRDLIGVLGGAATNLLFQSFALPAERVAQIRVIGVMDGTDDEDGKARLAVFRAMLQSLGWIEGRNVRFEYRWPEGKAPLIQRYAAELVRLNPDVILATGIPSVAALLHETSIIPVVMSIGSDPTTTGLVANLAKPGGNFTGFVNFEYPMAGKWLELLKEIAPRTVRVVVLSNPDNPTWPGRIIEAIASTHDLQVIVAGVRNGDEIERAITALDNQPNTGLLVLPLVINSSHRDLIITLTAKHHVPAIYPFRQFAAAGGLLSYGIEVRDLYRRAAGYVDRILKGEKPGQLPVQEPTKYELVINRKTAESLGLTLTPTLLARADEVIE